MKYKNLHSMLEDYQDTIEPELMLSTSEVIDEVNQHDVDAESTQEYADSVGNLTRLADVVEESIQNQGFSAVSEDFCRTIVGYERARFGLQTHKTKACVESLNWSGRVSVAKEGFQEIKKSISDIIKKMIDFFSNLIAKGKEVWRKLFEHNFVAKRQFDDLKKTINTQQMKQPVEPFTNEGVIRRVTDGTSDMTNGYLQSKLGLMNYTNGLVSFVKLANEKGQGSFEDISSEVEQYTRFLKDQTITPRPLDLERLVSNKLIPGFINQTSPNKQKGMQVFYSDMFPGHTRFAMTFPLFGNNEDEASKVNKIKAIKLELYEDPSSKEYPNFLDVINPGQISDLCSIIGNVFGGIERLESISSQTEAIRVYAKNNLTRLKELLNQNNGNNENATILRQIAMMMPLINLYEIIVVSPIMKMVSSFYSYASSLYTYLVYCTGGKIK